MKKVRLKLSVLLFSVVLLSCGGGKNSDTPETENESEEVTTQAAVPKTTEELREIEKVDEATIKAAENKEEFIRFSSSYNLTEFPMEILEAINIQTLELNNYRGATLPEELKNLPNLSLLYITGATNIAALPDFLPELKSLKTISITGAKILDLNQAFKILSKCPNIQYVEITYSTVPSEIPSEIGKLTNLKVLNISNNHITSFPEEFFTLPSLERVLISSSGETLYDYEELFNGMKNLPNLTSILMGYTGMTSLPKVLNEYPSLERFQWAEKGKGWENSDAIIKTTEKENKKFPNFEVTWSFGTTVFYDYY
jgi:Leucine-rich repeat (LRR) protein